MPGLPLSDEELSTVLREALLRIAKRYAPSEYPTEDADFAIIKRLLSLNPVGPRRDIIEEELMRAALRDNEVSTDKEDGEVQDE